MLTKRTLLLTAASLLTGFTATAQSTAAAGPRPTDILSWLAWGLAAVVLLFGIVTAISLAAAASQSVVAPATPDQAPTVVPEAPAEHGIAA